MLSQTSSTSLFPKALDRRATPLAKPTPETRQLGLISPQTHYYTDAGLLFFVALSVRASWIIGLDCMFSLLAHSVQPSLDCLRRWQPVSIATLVEITKNTGRVWATTSWESSRLLAMVSHRARSPSIAITGHATT